MQRRRLALWIISAFIAAVLACNAPPDLSPPFFTTATATATSTRTATFTPTATATATPTPTPTATATPTPNLDERLTDAERAVHNGDYDAAIETYRDLLTFSLDEGTAAQTRLGLGTAYLRDGNYSYAAEAFREFLVTHSESNAAPDAHFLLAEALVGAGDLLTATKEYRVYLSAGTVITAYVSEWLGDALYASDDYLAAAAAYEVAIADAPDRLSEVGVREKLALVYVALQDYAAAIAQYDASLEVAQIYGYSAQYRARIGHQAAETLLLAGEIEVGYNRHLAVVETYPTEYHAYLSLVKLVEAGRPVDELLRGKVDYYGGVYERAVEALYRYINADLEGHSGDAHWYAGLSFLELGDLGRAVAEFEMLIETHPGNAYWDDAWMSLAEIYADQGDVDKAVETYRQFVESGSGYLRAPEALWEAAQLLERAGDLEAAAEAYLDCHARYPDSDYGPSALFRSGLQSYQLGELADGAIAWETLATTYPDASCRLAALNTLHKAYPDTPCRLPALLWLGKLRLAQGEQEASAAAFEQVIAVDPSGYYGLRAADLAADPSALSFPPGQSADFGTMTDQQDEAEEWLAGWLGLDAAGDLGGLGPGLTADLRLQRGLELWRLGHFEEAKWEFEALRRATVSDALAQYQLALTFRDVGLYRSSILCATNLVALSPAATALDAPAFIARLAYPTYYEDLALQNARLSDLDPLLVFALIRQESLFESFATSHAAAHGLMQVIPATGAQIAAELGWPSDYETADLYRPYVSLRFGTYYLAQQRDDFDDRIDVALAAYNGGPFRAVRWLEHAAGDDPDLFFELITLREPRLYIQRIKEYLAVYRALYGN
jgi:soluble lytic murein transglycosylase